MTKLSFQPFTLSRFPAGRSRLHTLVCGLLLGCSLAAGQVSAVEPAPAAPAPRFFIREFQVRGARNLPRIDVESAVYPFLGPLRTEDDIEGARAALEKAYADAGWQTVSVSVPAQNISGGLVELRVLERPVGRLRVKGARYSSTRKIKSQAPSLAEGRVINFNEVPKDLLALNQQPGRQITPSLRAGVAPDTVDVDLEVKEEAPFKASVEVNNRRAPATTALRANVSLSANNLGQTGQAAGLSFQTSPQDTSEVKAYSAYWLARFPRAEWGSLLFQGTKSDSNVNTLGGAAVAGRGSTYGLRVLLNLPAVGDYSQSASFGFDYKHFDQTIRLAATSTNPAATIVAPITYYPLTAEYNGSWRGAHSTTAFNAGATFHLRGVGSSDALFNNSQYNAGGDFLIFRGELSHTHELGGFQLFGRVQGQLADQPLLSGEKFTLGGLNTVRGYREAEQVGESGVAGTIEVRSPSLLKQIGGAPIDWRLFAFADAGWLRVIDALPGQANRFNFLSYGAGTRFRWSDHFTASVIASVPHNAQGETPADEVRVSFQGILSY